jgi:hypothetical protein
MICASTCHKINVCIEDLVIVSVKQLLHYAEHHYIFSCAVQRHFLIFPEDISFIRETSQVLNNKAKCTIASFKVPALDLNLLFDNSIYMLLSIYI